MNSANEGSSGVTLNAAALGPVIAEALKGPFEGLRDSMNAGFNDLNSLIASRSGGNGDEDSADDCDSSVPKDDVKSLVEKEPPAKKKRLNEQGKNSNPLITKLTKTLQLTQHVQKSLTKGVIVVVSEVNKLMGNSETQKEDTVSALMDGVLLSENANQELNYRRRELMMPQLNTNYRHLCSPSNPATAELFGDDLPKAVKDTSDTNRLSSKLTKDGSSHHSKSSQQHHGWRGKKYVRPHNSNNKQSKNLNFQRTLHFRRKQEGNKKNDYAQTLYRLVQQQMNLLMFTKSFGGSSTTGNHDLTILAHSSLVATTSENDNCNSLCVPKAPGPTFAVAFSPEVSPLEKEVDYAGMSPVWQSIQDQGISQAAAKHIMVSWLNGTKKQYSASIKKWQNFSIQRPIDHTQPSVVSVLDFLTVLYQQRLT
ncbi:hypothetical protein AWC38_SpisGene18697 [Stylophora pistillata]|uniref:Uncharacterized protein n=1 Tax=Stylophora pistillata TaxID=50429 RepID=A0A2B4RL78_STYPI|nr:hypothetical protein AWC38_SpisGene18697 [Stylophora pistillata]